MYGFTPQLPPDRPHLEKGQGLVEYALILVLVAIVVIVILALLGPAISGIFGDISCTMKYPGQVTATGSDPTLTYELKLIWPDRKDQLVGDRTIINDSGVTPPDDAGYCWLIGYNDTEYHVIDLVGEP
ncbi:MAG: hypothetical protein K8L97_26635 [Anaerolineae bacterium]|nr:hypothetical protein [Anaerolineae bacterium]